MMPTTGAKRILLVEDDATVREVSAELLRRAGFSVEAIALAEYAFDALRSYRPDLVVLDLAMPSGTLQGIDFLAALREDPEWHATPVVILSGLGDAVNRDITRRLQVAAVFAKPLIDLDQFIGVIRGLLR
jgi:two-component system OmpR family response regulator